jgi:hypothetical protein
VCYSIPKYFRSPGTSLLLISNFIPFFCWEHDCYRFNLVFLWKIVLWPRIWSFLVKVLRALEKIVYSAVVGWDDQYKPIGQAGWCVLHISYLYLYYLNFLSTLSVSAKRRGLRSVIYFQLHFDPSLLLALWVCCCVHAHVGLLQPPRELILHHCGWLSITGMPCFVLYL